MKRPVVVDLFCGAGGESQGIDWAYQSSGVEIEMFAVNHWETAVETHARNFPQYETLCKDILDLDPLRVVPKRDVELLWASPACTHFSVARGGKPMDEQSRVTPFTVGDWLEKLNVKRFIIENVPEFEGWCPLGDDKRPVKELKGSTFQAYIALIRSLGYDVDWRVLNAADFGAPTTRKRLFIQGVKRGSGKRLVWPEATHSQTVYGGLFGDLKPWVPAREIIDWSLPTRLVDSRKRPLSDNTMRRIMQGVEKYWGEYARPFITRYNGGVNRNHSIDEPMPVLDTSNRYAIVEPLLMEYYGNGGCKPMSQPVGVVTTKERFALLEPHQVGIGFRMLQPHELAAAQSFPKGYKFMGTKSEVVKQIGNSVCPKIAESLVGAGLAK
jgi:DNA (cytosine-5)-methyltransferase 1